MPRASYSISRKRSGHEAKPSEDVHPPSSSLRKVSLSATQGPKTPSPRRAVVQNHDSSTNFRQNLPTIRLTSSSSLAVVIGKKVPRTLQHAKRMECEPFLPRNHFENQATKKSVSDQLHFKKPCPQPDDDSSAMILTSDVPDGGSTNLHSPQGDSHHPPAQFVPPQEELTNSARQLFEVIDVHDMPSA